MSLATQCEEEGKLFVLTGQKVLFLILPLLVKNPGHFPALEFTESFLSFFFFLKDQLHVNSHLAALQWSGSS